jgi:hypothetical protein
VYNCCLNNSKNAAQTTFCQNTFGLIPSNAQCDSAVLSSCRSGIQATVINGSNFPYCLCMSAPPSDIPMISDNYDFCLSQQCWTNPQAYKTSAMLALASCPLSVCGLAVTNSGVGAVYWRGYITNDCAGTITPIVPASTTPTTKVPTVIVTSNNSSIISSSASGTNPVSGILDLLSSTTSSNDIVIAFSVLGALTLLIGLYIVFQVGRKGRHT